MISPLTLALCWFGNDHHTGQASRGYKILCKALRRAKRQGCDRPLDLPSGDYPEALKIYDYLTAAYWNKV